MAVSHRERQQRVRGEIHLEFVVSIRINFSRFHGYLSFNEMSSGSETAPDSFVGSQKLSFSFSREVEEALPLAFKLDRSPRAHLEVYICRLAMWFN